MLKPVEEQTNGHYMNFGSIGPDSHGQGMCYVYNAIAKKTRAGKPFVTLFLRDICGNVIPGYIFDLKSPLQAGEEMVKVINSIVLIDWQENYLKQVGLTLIVDKLAVVNNPTAEDMAKFCGSIQDTSQKRAYIEDTISKRLSFKVMLPQVIESYSSLEYSQGRIGGLCQHYWQMCQVIETFGNAGTQTDEECRRLFSTFALYILAHSTYVRAHEGGDDGIDLIVNLTNKLTNLSSRLNLGAGSMEIVNMFFGYVPRDIYVRTIVSISEMVLKTTKEFAVYRTIPLQQEGTAGYGTIRRYALEEG